MTKLARAAISSAMMIALFAATPDTARADVPEGGDPGFCLSGQGMTAWENGGYLYVLYNCEDAGGYGIIVRYSPAQ